QVKLLRNKRQNTFTPEYPAPRAATGRAGPRHFSHSWLTPPKPLAVPRKQAPILVASPHDRGGALVLPCAVSFPLLASFPDAVAAAATFLPAILRHARPPREMHCGVARKNEKNRAYRPWQNFPRRRVAPDSVEYGRAAGRLLPLLSPAIATRRATPPQPDRAGYLPRTFAMRRRDRAPARRPLARARADTIAETIRADRARTIAFPISPPA